MGFEPRLHSWQANVLPPLHIGGAYQMEISVDQYAALHQHYDSVQTTVCMSLQCEPLDNIFVHSLMTALLQHVVTRDGGNKKVLVTCEYCCWDQLYV